MAFRCKIDDIVEIVFLKQRSHQLLVANITLRKDVARIPFYTLEVFQVACIGQLVAIDEQDVVIFLQHIVNKVGADKADTTGDQIFLHVRSCPILR